MRAIKPLLIIVAVLASAFALNARAQTAPTSLSGVVISWATDTYVPTGFQGKRLPTSGSDIAAWVIIFVAGKPVSAANYTVQWYANEELLQSGRGLAAISFKAPWTADQIVRLQARVQSPDGDLSVARIQVPVVSPKIAIRADYPGGVFTGPSANVAALPYFFNVSDASSLTFQWSANGVTAQNSESPDSAVITLGDNAPSGTSIRVQVTATNSGGSTAATAYVNLTYQKI